MYKHNQKQLELEEFSLPIGGHLAADNRWVKLAGLIPWEQYEEMYCSNLAGSGQGALAFSVRMALAALIIKQKLNISDEECVAQIRENPYLQYFCGMKQFSVKPPFHSTMFVHFRKRFPADVISRVNEIIVAKATGSLKERNDDDSPSDDVAGGKPKSGNQDKLLVDATCVPSDITYPTDLKLLNQAREKSEAIIDALHKSRGAA